MPSSLARLQEIARVAATAPNSYTSSPGSTQPAWQYGPTYSAHVGCAHRLQRCFCGARKRAQEVSDTIVCAQPAPRLSSLSYETHTYGQNDKRHARSHDKAPPPWCL